MKIGVVILLTGLVFLGMDFITKLGPLGRLGLIYLAGGALGAAGWVIKRRYTEAVAYGKVLIGGGMATVYYATYAAHFVEPLRVIASPLVGGALLLGLAAGIIWLADRLRSEGIAAAVVVLGFYTGAINPVAGFSLFSNLVLSGMAIVLLLRRRWQTVSFLSLIGCYGAFAYWRMQVTGTLTVFRAENAEVFRTGVVFPACYWVVFTVATFLGRIKGQDRGLTAGAAPTFLTINNGAFFALVSPLIAGTYGESFWLFALINGVVLLALAGVAAKADEKTFDGAYLAQGLTMVFLAVVLKFSGYQAALSMALGSAALMRLSKYRQGVIFQVFSGIGAVLAVLYAGINLVADTPHATLTSAVVAVIVAGTAWIFKQHRGLLNTFQWRAMGFAALAAGLGVATIWQGVPGSVALDYFVVLAVVLTASVYVVRVPELVYAAQGVAGVAVFQWFARLVFRAFQGTSVLEFPVALVVAALTLMHWWQRQGRIPLGDFWRKFWESLQAAAVVAVVFSWALVRFSEPNLTFAMGLTGLALLTYAYLTRAVALGIGSQIFAAVAVEGVFIDLYNKTSWPLVLTTLVILLTESLVIEALTHRSTEFIGTMARRYSQVLRAVAFFLGLYFIEDYAPETWKFVVLAGVAFGCFVIGLGTRKAEAMVYAAVAILWGYGKFASGNLNGLPVFWPDLAGLGLMLLAQQVGKLRLDPNAFGPEIQGTLITAGVAGAWLMTHRMVAGMDNGFLITVSWSLVAFVTLAAGFLLGERTYRLLGLGILAAAIGRLFLLDVWQLEKIYRYLSFIVLGVVLLVFGFLYNRFADKIRKWI